MSLVAKTSDDAESEALVRAQRAHEPSMDEILASIRAIIADDREPAPKPGPQIVYSADAPLRAAEPESAPNVAATRTAETVSVPAEDEEAPLLSEETEAAVAASFQTLAESMAEHGREVAEKMAREMLRPMLKEWLDANLPPLVERLVKGEIQRLARGRR